MPVRKPKEESSPLERFRKVFAEVEAPKGGLPTMPVTIAETSSTELGNMIAKYSAWREFTEDRHMEACAVYDLACDKAMLSAGGGTVTERKTSAKVTPEVEKLNKKLLEAEIFRDLLAGKLESFSNVLAMLSRELTRRGVENM